MAIPLTLDDLRRFAVARSLFAPTTLRRALARMGFVQADPIRAPARAQDLILRQRVKDYRAGDLERRYETRANRSGCSLRHESAEPHGGLYPWKARLADRRNVGQLWVSLGGEYCEALTFPFLAAEGHPKRTGGTSPAIKSDMAGRQRDTEYG